MKKNWVIFLFFVIIVFIVRLPSLFQSRIIHDEALYLLVGRSILEGNPPYVEVWDNKPPGLFVIYAIALKVFGNSVVSIWIIACIAVIVTCFLLYLTGKVLFKTQGDQIGLIAGIFYAIFTLINGGIGAQAEIFFIPPVVLAFYLLFSGKKIYSEKLMSFNNFGFLGMGLSIGVAAQIKYLVVFDFIALLIIIAKDIYSKYSRERIQFLLSKIIRHFTLVGSGVILVFSGTFFYFLYNGYFHEYFYATLLFHRQYVGTAEFSLIHFIGSLGGQVVRHFILYFSLFITPIFLYANNLNYSKAKKNIVYLIIWFLITFMATLISKRYYGHYFLQLLPPLCLVSSYVVTRTFYSSREFTKVKQRLILIPVTLGLLVSSHQLSIQSM
ncbi:ArnT family glycosyltransferase [Coleofasciculus sp.]|uniref:ArnT family glycosyltransferase n=1 Tax=Coleofasciculus sp. TaxID=3100458 RepID=UPI0039F8FA2D